MQCKDLEFVLEQEGFAPLPGPAQEHLAACDSCQSLVADFTAIVRAAQALPSEVEPPARLWVSLRSQLQAEGILRDASAPPKTSWLHAFAGLLRGQALATATACLIVVLATAVAIRYKPHASPQFPPPYAALHAELASEESSVQNAISSSGAAPSTADLSLRDNLRVINSFITDCEQRVRQAPDDGEAQQYLTGAYQQKSELLATMMERGAGGE